MRKIKIVIKEDGTVEADAIGFQGKACEEAMKFISDALGEEISEKKKAEYHRRDKRGQQQKAGQ